MSDQECESFYDVPGVYDRYTAHRKDNRLSPNYVMEEPAFLNEVGDPTGLRVLDLGCGDGAFGRLLLTRRGFGGPGHRETHAALPRTTWTVDD